MNKDIGCQIISVLGHVAMAGVMVIGLFLVTTVIAHILSYVWVKALLILGITYWLHVNNVCRPD